MCIYYPPAVCSVTARLDSPGAVNSGDQSGEGKPILDGLDHAWKTAARLLAFVQIRFFFVQPRYGLCNGELGETVFDITHSFPNFPQTPQLTSLFSKLLLEMSRPLGELPCC